MLLLPQGQNGPRLETFQKTKKNKKKKAVLFQKSGSPEYKSTFT
jgi:hypothetical protein